MKKHNRYVSLTATVLLAFFMAIFFSASFPFPSHAETGDRDFHKPDFHKSYKVPSRLHKISSHGKRFADRMTPLPDPVYAWVCLMLYITQVRFRPFYGWLLKKLLLLPLKFTSKFVAHHVACSVFDEPVRSYRPNMLT